MSEYTLRLLPKSSDQDAPPPVDLELFPWEKIQDGSPQGRQEHAYVLNDFDYTGELLCPPGTPEPCIWLYCNDYRIKLEQSYDKATGVLAVRAHKTPFRDKLFRDPFGFARLTVGFLEKGAQEPSRFLQTLLIPVYVNPDDEETKRISASIREMADYVFTHCDPFWTEDQIPDREEDNTPSLVLNGLKPSARKELDAHIQLLEEIVHTYTRALPLFRTSSQYQVRPERQWVSLERAAHLSSATFHGMLQRPCHLIRAGPSQGVAICGKRYIPSKVIADTGLVDYDIYENQYVVGFLRRLLESLWVILADLDKRLAGIPKSRLISGHVASIYYLYGSMPQTLAEHKHRLTVIRKKLSELYGLYRELLPAAPAQVRDAPKATAIFRSVHGYRQIYELACRWFRFGVYDFRREDFLLPFVAGHVLYEYYALIKLLRHLTDDQGFPPPVRRSIAWQAAERKKAPAVPQDQGRPNCFSFQKEEWRLTIYYEPRIFCYGYPYRLRDADQPEGAEPGLFRSNVSPYDEATGRPGGSCHCKPDYLLRLQKGEGPAYYVLLDAKFSSLTTAEQHHAPSLLLKYLASLAAYHPERGDRILGLCLLCGKPGGRADDLDQSGLSLNAYCVPERNSPFVRLIPLRPDNEELHTRALSLAMNLDEIGLALGP